MASDMHTSVEQRPLVTHLLELRSRLLRAVVGLLVVLAAMLPFANKLYGLGGDDTLTGNAAYNEVRVTVAPSG